MTDKEFKRLSRAQLIEIIYQLQLEIDKLNEEKQELENQLADKRLRLNKAGNIAEVVAIGPPIMMKFCALTTKPYNVFTTVSLNTIMIDGTGMCGGCRVNVGGEVKFVCVDGPEFDGHKVDFDNMMMRMKAFKKREDEDRHKCHLEMEIAAKKGE